MAMFHFRIKSDKKPDDSKISLVKYVDYIRRQGTFFEKDYKKMLDSKFDFQHKIIFPQRAVAMAKNIFVHGNLKTLRADLRKYHKDEQRFQKSLSNFNLRQKNLCCRTSVFITKKYFIAKHKLFLDLEQKGLGNIKISLENRANELQQFF